MEIQQTAVVLKLNAATDANESDAHGATESRTSAAETSHAQTKVEATDREPGEASSEVVADGTPKATKCSACASRAGRHGSARSESVQRSTSPEETPKA